MALNFERSQDYTLIRQIITHPAIWPHVSDDYTPKPEEWKPAENDSVWYVLVYDGGELLGLWTFIPETAICWKVHTCLLPCAWGYRSRIAARQMAEWIFANTACLRIITDVPEYNRHALKFAKDAGMHEFGYNAASYMKNGILHGQHLLGISKETQCQ